MLATATKRVVLKADAAAMGECWSKWKSKKFVCIYVNECIFGEDRRSDKTLSLVLLVILLSSLSYRISVVERLAQIFIDFYIEIKIKINCVRRNWYKICVLSRG